ncbi:hypothetical protein [Paenibacillus prosopidis]|nr:hypothetical protein [Paenibacillus prosopidis]
MNNSAFPYQKDRDFLSKFQALSMTPKDYRMKRLEFPYHAIYYE